MGYLHPGKPGATPDVIRSALHELGWIDGQNLVFERRFAEGLLENLPGLAAELVRLKVDVIIPLLNDAIAAAKQATGSIPIVMLGATDPVGMGFVTSLARPGGNITGTTSNMPEVTGGKALELLKEAVPGARHIGILFEPDYPGMTAFIREADASARALGVRLERLEIRTPGDLDAVFARLRRTRPEALDVLISGILVAQRHRVLTFAAEQRLPTMWPGVALLAEEGGLMTYGFNLHDIARRTATLADKILRGATPGDLPVEQPSKFDLVINLKTAKSLGLAIPRSLLLRADRVIE